MNLQDFKYLVALADKRHFGRAAEACNVSQPTLSSQIRKLEDVLGVRLLERTNKRVELTPVGRKILEHAQEALAQAHQMETVAQAARDPLVGPLKLGVIPTLAPYLMPIILKPLRTACPNMPIQLWEDQTRSLIEGLRSHRLDAALLATPAAAPEVTEIELFREPLLAVLPPDHRLAGAKSVREEDLAEDLLVLAEGHCLADQALAACGSANGLARNPLQSSMQAATLETLVHLVAAGYGATLIPWLAKDSLSGLGIAARTLTGESFRSIRLVSRPGFPRPQALRALENVVRRELKFHLPSGCVEPLPPVEKQARKPARNPKKHR
ncbi:MAG TPA: LysR substrate-binding domain-containing protein [Terracidiphilus sp.]|jgi:LysR family hydrogen peroxide-inducible transcriptional activator|nr:LysR substrate-binding domain-containing protein [Terracidiphilus sp.]